VSSKRHKKRDHNKGEGKREYGEEVHIMIWVEPFGEGSGDSTGDREGHGVYSTSRNLAKKRGQISNPPRNFFGRKGGFKVLLGGLPRPETGEELVIHRGGGRRGRAMRKTVG